MADEVISQATGFSVKILEGPHAGTNIFLDGRAMPYEEVSLDERVQRIKTTWNPGNLKATQQKLGRILPPCVIHGTWKDVFLGDGQARALLRTFQDLLDSGVDVEVAWGVGLDELGGTTGETIVMRGAIKRVKPTYFRPQDIGWEIEFEWSSAGDPAFTPVFAAGIITERDGFEQLVDDTQQVVDAIDAEKESLLDKLSGLNEFQTWKDRMDDIQNNLAAGIYELDTISFTLSTLSDVSVDTFQRVQSASDMIVGFCARLSSSITGFQEVYYAEEDARDSLLGLASRMRYALFPTDDPIDYLDGQTRQYDMLHKADQAAASALAQSDAAKAKEIPEIQKELYVPAGTDLRDVARDVWGDPDAWWTIADFNGLDSSRVPDMPTGPSDFAGYPIYIPVRSTERGSKPYGGAGC